jgi:hypothetical protein
MSQGYLQCRMAEASAWLMVRRQLAVKRALGWRLRGAESQPPEAAAAPPQRTEGVVHSFDDEVAGPQESEVVND